MDPQTQAQAQAQAAHLAATLMPIILIVGLIVYALLIIPQWRIATKAGLSGPISLLTLIPGIGLLVSLYVIAFMEWRVVPIAQAQAYPPVYPPQYPPAGYPPQT